MDRVNRHVPGPLLFLSHAGADTEPARRLKTRLEATPEAKTAGLHVWFDKDDLRPGEQTWQAQLEQVIEHGATAFAVYVGSKGVINWVEAEVRLALSRAMSKEAHFPFIPVIAATAGDASALPGFARQFQCVRDVENRSDEFQKLLAAVLDCSDEAGTLATEADPFFGLRAIDEKRSHLFFGRERESDDLIRRLRNERLLMVIGDSGSGKSSLVKAGVIPRWRGGVLAELDARRPDEDIWHVIEFRPRSNPCRSLGEAVYKGAGVLQRAAADQGIYQTWAMGDDPELRRQGLRCGLDPTCTRTLVVVDQLEELVTQTPRDQRQPFIDLLLDLADPVDPAFAVVLTMRRDYYNLLSAPECRALYDRLEAGDRQARYVLGRMSDEGLRQIVIKPLELAGIASHEREELANAVLGDVGERPGDLALVQFALTRAWERRAEFEGNLVRAYVGVGGVDGALAREADCVFEHVLGGQANETEVAATLIRLARLEGTAGPTRRGARRREFSEARWQLLQKLASEDGNRLVLLSGQPKQTGPPQPSVGETAEISHEALLTRWPRLHAWLNEAPDDKRILDRLTGRAGDWTDAATAEAKIRLLARTDSEREAFEALARTRPHWLSDEEKAFVAASVEDHQVALAERTGLLKRLRRRAWGASSIAVAAVLAAGVAVVFYQRADMNQKQAKSALEQAINAQRTAHENETRALAALSEAASRQNHFTDGLKLALAAWPRTRDDGRRPMLRRAVDAVSLALAGRLELTPPLRHNGGVISVAFSPDGTRLATASFDKTARLWRLLPPAPNIFATACAMLHDYNTDELKTRYGIAVSDPLCLQIPPAPDPKLLTD
jgi:TIR domain